MQDYESLREIQKTYSAAAEGKTPWPGDHSLALATQISILAGHMADQMLPVAPPPPCDDEHVLHGCRLFSDASVYSPPLVSQVS